jgi:hypothetical protein
MVCIYLGPDIYVLTVIQGKAQRTIQQQASVSRSRFHFRSWICCYRLSTVYPSCRSGPSIIVAVTL